VRASSRAFYHASISSKLRKAAILPKEPLIKSSTDCVAGKMRMNARRATKVVARTTKPRRARAALHLRSCAAERAVARRIAVARTSARLRGRTYRAPRFGEHDADAAFCRNPKGRLPRHGQRSLGCGSGSMSAPFHYVSCGSLRPFPLHAHASPSPGRLSGRSALSLGLPRGMAIGCASLRASHSGKPPSQLRGT